MSVRESGRCPPAEPGSNVEEIWALCRVPKTEIVYLRYTMEAYEGLCVPTTVPGGQGLVWLFTSPGQRAELEAILEDLAEELPLSVESWGRGPGTVP